MNPLSDPLGFDALEQTEQVTEIVPLDSPIPLDPLDAMLAGLERSIEQPPVPELDQFADPLARTLDRVEASVERPRYGMPQFESPSLLDLIEMQAEHQVVPPESSPADFDPGPHEVESRRPLSGSGGSLPPGMGGPVPERPRGRDYIHRPSGSGSGIRAQTTMVYCTLRQEWVDAGECRECPDFEPVDNVAGDDEEHCRHASQNRD